MLITFFEQIVGLGAKFINKIGTTYTYKYENLLYHVCVEKSLPHLSNQIMEEYIHRRMIKILRITITEI